MSTSVRVLRSTVLWLPLLAGGMLAGCGPSNAFVPPPPPEVTVAHPVERDVVDYVEFTGSTKATATVELRARVNGYLERILVEDGANVKRGDLLFVIEQSTFKTSVESAEAKLQKAEAAQQLAEAQTKRTNELFERKAATPEEVDVQLAQLNSSRADVAAAKADLKQALIALSCTEIKAPISGRMGRHMVDIGNLVTAEQTVLANIESIDPIHAQFYLSENDLLKFMGMLRENKLPDPEQVPPELTLQLANETGFPHKGHLDYRELGVDPKTGTILRRGIFPNPDLQLIPGLFVRIRADVGEARPRILVQDRAIAADQRGDYVLVVNAENVVEYRPVKLGQSSNGLRVVESGVEKDDWIIVNGIQRARPGATVVPQQEEQQTAESATTVSVKQ